MVRCLGRYGSVMFKMFVSGMFKSFLKRCFMKIVLNCANCMTIYRNPRPLVPIYSGTNLYLVLVPLFSGTEFVPRISTTI